MKPLVVTAARLKRWGLCGDGVSEFRRQFPRGITLRNAVDPKIPEAAHSMQWGSLVQVLHGKPLERYLREVGKARALYVQTRKAELVWALAMMDAKGELPK